MKEDAKFKVGEEYFHVNNKKIITIVENSNGEDGKVRAALPDGYEFNAWTSLLRKLTKLELALK
jgi:hypothetical protein